ncbi:MAG TPA: glycosyltransferase family 1 protein, partial [Actinomycetota bacterium]|nr:glycosyltransferase family 1 protein [Actinomycetota bacterium]
MRIAIDARAALDPRPTGVGHYTRQMIRHLPAADPLPEYVAWYLHAKGLLTRTRFFTGLAPNLTEHPSRFPARVFQPVSWRLGLPRLEWLLDFDALLATNFLPPATKRAGVVMVVHDLAFERFPETAPQIDRRWRRRFARWLRRSAGVIVPSESARADLLAGRDLDAARVHVIPHGVEPFPEVPRTEVSRVRATFGIGGRYALFVGGIEPRKNLEGLVEAFRGAETDAWLVIAGGPVRWIPQAERRLRSTIAGLPEEVGRRVVLTGYVSEADKRALLAGATALAYPSRYEGFGFPVLEAFAAGVPVLTSETAALPEVAGSAALLVDPDDPAAIRRELERLLSDPGLRDGLRRAGLE